MQYTYSSNINTKLTGIRYQGIQMQFTYSSRTKACLTGIGYQWIQKRSTYSSRINARLTGVIYPQIPMQFTYDYKEIEQLYSEKNSCVAEWFNQPRFIAKFVQEHGMDAIDEYEKSYKL